ncbi:hypothetical protein ACRQ4C_08405 [Curtobacterium sp. SP.BCp]|uniref:hypothetical protein n=1 Tax=Curtobacterium sp. SP.BCp TaxID=3435230 RepID=UPI003F739660
MSAEAFSNVGNRTSMQLVLASACTLAVLAAVCTVVAMLVVQDLTDGTFGDSAHVVLTNVGGGIAGSLDALFGGALALLLGFYAVVIGPRVVPGAMPVPELNRATRYAVPLSALFSTCAVLVLFWSIGVQHDTGRSLVALLEVLVVVVLAGDLGSETLVRHDLRLDRARAEFAQADARVADARARLAEASHVTATGAILGGIGVPSLTCLVLGFHDSPPSVLDISITVGLFLVSQGLFACAIALRDTESNPFLRIFAMLFAAPVPLFLLFFGALLAAGGQTWTGVGFFLSTTMIIAANVLPRRAWLSRLSWRRAVISSQLRAAEQTKRRWSGRLEEFDTQRSQDEFDEHALRDALIEGLSRRAVPEGSREPSG